MDVKNKGWLFIYLCPYFQKGPQYHRKHIRWVPIEDKEEAECLARGNDLAWPAASAGRGTIYFTEIYNETDFRNPEDYVKTILQSKIDAYNFVKKLSEGGEKWQRLQR